MNSSTEVQNIKNGDVYLIDLKDTYCNVQSGLRPCLVIQNDCGNAHSPTVIVVPITSKLKKRNMPVHVVVEQNNNTEMVLCECILTVSKEQIGRYLRTFDDGTMQKVRKALEVSLGFKDRRQ